MGTKKKRTIKRASNHSSERMTQTTLDEARAKISSGASRTDWKRIDAQTDEEIDRAIVEDPDAAPAVGAEFWRTADLLTNAATAEKVVVTLRIDRDVVKKFKELGPGYQSRMNAVLRAYAGSSPDE